MSNYRNCFRRRENLGDLAQKVGGKDANLRALARKFQVSGVPPEADQVSDDSELRNLGIEEFRNLGIEEFRDSGIRELRD